MVPAVGAHFWAPARRTSPFEYLRSDSAQQWRVDEGVSKVLHPLAWCGWASGSVHDTPRRVAGASETPYARPSGLQEHLSSGLPEWWRWWWALACADDGGGTMRVRFRLA
jgi:hypothetical protein